MNSKILEFIPRTSGFQRIVGIYPGLQTAKYRIHPAETILEQNFRRTGG
jgi:hypothetical protein